VPATVEQDDDLVLPGPRDDDRIGPHLRLDEVFRIRDLALVAHQQPGAAEDLPHFLGKQVIVHEHATIRRSCGNVYTPNIGHHGTSSRKTPGHVYFKFC